LLDEGQVDCLIGGEPLVEWVGGCLSEQSKRCIIHRHSAPGSLTHCTRPGPLLLVVHSHSSGLQECILAVDMAAVSMLLLAHSRYYCGISLISLLGTGWLSLLLRAVKHSPLVAWLMPQLLARASPEAAAMVSCSFLWTTAAPCSTTKRIHNGGMCLLL